MRNESTDQLNIMYDKWGPSVNIQGYQRPILINVISLCLCSSPAPKIVFHRLNGKRYHRSTSPKAANTTEGFTPAHEDNVRFVYEGELIFQNTSILVTLMFKTLRRAKVG